MSEIEKFSDDFLEKLVPRYLNSKYYVYTQLDKSIDFIHIDVSASECTYRYLNGYQHLYDIKLTFDNINPIQFLTYITIIYQLLHELYVVSSKYSIEETDKLINGSVTLTVRPLFGAGVDLSHLVIQIFDGKYYDDPIVSKFSMFMDQLNPLLHVYRC